MLRLVFFASLVLALCFSGQLSTAAVVGADDGSHTAYDDGWQGGDDGSTSGNAFGVWTLDSGSVGGFFIGDSTNLSGGSGADINSSGESFGLFGAAPTGFATATRDLNGALSVGQVLSMDLAVNFRNGNKGVNIRDGGGTEIFNFNNS